MATHTIYASACVDGAGDRPFSAANNVNGSPDTLVATTSGGTFPGSAAYINCVFNCSSVPAAKDVLTVKGYIRCRSQTGGFTGTIFLDITRTAPQLFPDTGVPIVTTDITGPAVTPASLGLTQAFFHSATSTAALYFTDQEGFGAFCLVDAGWLVLTTAGGNRKRKFYRRQR